MDPWFSSIATERCLPPAAVRELAGDGFVVIPGPVPESMLGGLAASYDYIMIHADPADVSTGRSTIRVSDLVNRSAVFDELYVYPPVLEACCRLIGQPFKLSTMHGRTLKAGAGAQGLHVDFPGGGAEWPMVGFIYMLDEFRVENGATCFVPGSQGEPNVPADGRPREPACGPAGSMIVFNGSVWHGHGPNETGQPRRSIQGAYIRRCENSGVDLPGRMRTETLDRIGPLAKYVLAAGCQGVW